MTALPEVEGNPSSLDQLRAELGRVHRESVAYWSRYDDTAFFAPMGEHWSAADHVRHLNRSIRAVTRAMRLPRLLLRVMFGRPAATSRSFEVLRADYHGVLAAGGRAGSYGPAPLPEASRTGTYRAELMTCHEDTVGALVRVLAGWRDDALEGAALPHPLLGPLTLREMIQFTLYHNLHHVHVAERRRAASGPAIAD